MRNICFCVSTEPLIVQGKGYPTPIQAVTMKIRALSEPVELTISFRFFLPVLFFPALFLTLILYAFILLIVLMLHVLSRTFKYNGVRNSKQ